MLALTFDDVIIEEVNVVHDVIPEWRSCSSLDLKNDRVTFFINTSCVDLRAEEHLASFHIPEVIFFLKLGLLGLIKLLLGEVSRWIENVVVVEEL